MPAVVAAVTLTGCSLFSARRPGGDWRASTAPDCNSGKGTVFLDGTMAVALGLTSLVAASEDGAVAGIALIGAAIYAGSAGYGASSANKCRAAIGEHEDYLEQIAVAPDRSWDDPPPAKSPPVTAIAPPLAPDSEPKPARPQPIDPVPDLEPAPSTSGSTDDDWASFWIEVSP